LKPASEQAACATIAPGVEWVVLLSSPAAAEGRSGRFTNQGMEIYKTALKSQRLLGGKDAGSLLASLIEYSQQHTAQCIHAL